MIPALMWCEVCKVERVPLVEDGTCGWCGKAKRKRATAPYGHGDRRQVEAVAAAVAARYDLTLDDLRARTRTQPAVRVRQLAMAAARDAGASYPAIAAVLDRDHSTVISAVRAFEEAGRALPTLAPTDVSTNVSKPTGVSLRLAWGTWAPAIQSITRSAA